MTRKKQLWIGFVEVRRKSVEVESILGGAKGAFVKTVTWASDADEYQRNATLVVEKLGLSVVNVEKSGLVSKNAELFDDEVADMIDRAESNPKAIIYGTFHTWGKDSA